MYEVKSVNIADLQQKYESIVLSVEQSCKIKEKH